MNYNLFCFQIPSRLIICFTKLDKCMIFLIVLLQRFTCVASAICIFTLIVGKNFGYEIFAEKFGKEELDKRLKDELIVSGQHFGCQFVFR